ncbi:type II (glutathione peroxidase-like) tryparedoxin peroxidase [Leishmania tarentolae]|uniref:Glutathione peroxidase n=1 Tax=Leishmania tarentolae TaxID=5689 RepID=A0A640KPP8_LEITA|nr:type II (glutathione peroxidase-like) tryparedoxin peroxidase [Leishmania tarentolae]
MLRLPSFRHAAASVQASSIYDFKVNGSDHQPYDLGQHKGHPLLIYNVASKCGFTKGGYETATALYNKYKHRGFTVLAFPCNQFAGQEPGTEEEVKEFACTRFKAEFPIMEKICVNGDKEHPLYHYLKNTCKGVLGTTLVKWNFTAFLVDKDGHAVHRFSPGATMAEIEKELVPLLQASGSSKL